MTASPSVLRIPNSGCGSRNRGKDMGERADVGCSMSALQLLTRGVGFAPIGEQDRGGEKGTRVIYGLGWCGSVVFWVQG